MKRIGILLVISACLFTTQTSQAVDLANRLGVGYSDQLSTSVPAMTVRYFPNSSTGLSLAVGINTENNNSRFGALAKLYRIIFTEQNLNFYIGGGAGMLSREEPNDALTGVDNNSGFELMGILGCEFFFSGLENLGFSFEAGVGIRSDSDGTLFRTIGDNPFKAGVTFYF